MLGREGLVMPSSPRRTAEMMRGIVWDCPRISRGNNTPSFWSLVSLFESGVLFIAYLYQGHPRTLCSSYTRRQTLSSMLRTVTAQ